MKGVAAANPPHAASRSGESAVFSHRLNKVVAARRVEPALTANKGAERHLVAANNQDQDPGGEIDQGFPEELHVAASPALPEQPPAYSHQNIYRLRAALRASVTSARAISSIARGSPPRGETIRSAAGNSARCVRKASRIWRFQRFRTTALPTRRDTLIPSRDRPTAFSHACTTSAHRWPSGVGRTPAENRRAKAGDRPW